MVLEELINHQLAEGHDVTLLTARHPGSQKQEVLASGLHIIRVGSNRYLHPPLALFYFLKNLRGKFDMIIETVNTAPYFALLFRGKTKGVALYHQLARKVWFFESKAPISHLGYFLIEPAATWLLGRTKAPLITVSESTKKDLTHFGWREEQARIISEGIKLEPLDDPNAARKYHRPTMLSLGAIRGMKRTMDQIKAFEIAKKSMPDLQLKIAGSVSDAYGLQVLGTIESSQYGADIQYLGRVSEAQKCMLMRRAHVITVTSVKEGWGLIVTEAAAQGTPAVVYDADGLRDSVRDQVTGLTTAATPEALAEGVVELLTDDEFYQDVQKDAWAWSKTMTFDKSYQDFKKVLKEAWS